MVTDANSHIAGLAPHSRMRHYPAELDASQSRLARPESVERNSHSPTDC